jgi:mono/diheme cytochrome c family protein
MRIFVSFLLAIVVFIAGVTAFVFSGIYNVSAMVPHWPITIEILEEARDQSISYHSKGIVAPLLNVSKMEEAGFNHFQYTCRLCHNAPGIAQNEFAQGLYPTPPDLASSDLHLEMNDAEIFWIIKNGLKMTGMPSFGVTHSDQEIWDIVAFVDRLPTLQPDQYKTMLKEAGQHDGQHNEPGEGASHGDGAHHHGRDGQSRQP